MAANTLLSELGGKVIMGSQHDEIIETWLADGTCKAGWLVGVDGTDLVVAGSNDGTYEFFTGIALPRYDTDCDTAFTGDDMIEVVIPQSGHYYAVFCTDTGGTLEGGHALTMGAEAGCVLKCATFDGAADLQVIGTNKEQVLDNTLFLIMRWA